MGSAAADLVISEAQARDAERLSHIHTQCFPHGWTTQEMAASLHASGCLAYLALLNKRPAGFMIARSAGDEAEILTLAVLPGARRQGIGKALLNHALQAAAAQNIKMFFLEVEDGNVAAYELYKDAGFEQISRRPAYYRQEKGQKPKDALVMRRRMR